MSAERFFDDLARTLAEPMPRGRAVRVIGTSLAALAVPGVSPRVARAVTAGSSDVGPSVCPGKQLCSTYIDPNNWPAGQKHKCCPFPRQQWRCGSDGWTCLDTCAALGKSLGKKTVPTWSTETMGGSDPTLSAVPKRYDCCIQPEFEPRNGECIPTCAYTHGPGSFRCKKTCCSPRSLCQSGKCVPACSDGYHRCAHLTRTCCPDNWKCCGQANCCAPSETCCGDSCCPKGKFCCGKANATRCCDEGEYCMYRLPAGWDPSRQVGQPPIVVCAAKCDVGARCGKSCCGGGYICKRGKCVLWR